MRRKQSKLKPCRHNYFSTCKCNVKIKLSFEFTIKMILLLQSLYGNETYIKIIN